jgi:hypothetical protein
MIHQQQTKQNFLFKKQYSDTFHKISQNGAFCIDKIAKITIKVGA